jgi:hypothetical protein
MAAGHSPFLDFGQKKSLNLLQADLTILTIINQNLRAWYISTTVPKFGPALIFFEKKSPHRYIGKGIWVESNGFVKPLIWTW